MRRAGLLLALTGLAFVLAGCPPAYPKCGSDNDCKDHNEYCVQGQCQECAGDQNCKEGFVCQANKCVPKPECTDDSGCTGGKKCRAGKCAYECEQNADCGAGKCVNHACTTAPNACSNDSDCASGESCEQNTCQTKQAPKTCNWDPIHFDFNDANLNADARSQLDGLVDCIKSAGKVTLEGNADERGTEEYNLQLSNRRAASVKKYLVDLGVPASKLSAVGYGENRPVNRGHNEEAWAQNRRVEFKH